jgi:hypothetical protein
MDSLGRIIYVHAYTQTDRQTHTHTHTFIYMQMHTHTHTGVRVRRRGSTNAVSTYTFFFFLYNYAHIHTGVRVFECLARYECASVPATTRERQAVHWRRHIARQGRATHSEQQAAISGKQAAGGRGRETIPAHASDRTGMRGSVLGANSC